MSKIKEFGDFQTPAALARDVCTLLSMQGLQPAALLEPTCGLGAFLFAGLDRFEVKKALGADINAQYVQQATITLQQRRDKNVQFVEADFFDTDWTKVTSQLPEPILVLGNLPWVTNSHLSTLGSQNLPSKSNFQDRDGMAAITGKSNFDISEWMLIRLLEAMNGRSGTLAMLCKSSVARKVLNHGWNNNVGLERSSIYQIDANHHFDAAVDAVLLVMYFKRECHNFVSHVYPHLDNDTDPITTIGYEDGVLLADIEAYHRRKHLCGNEIIKWRSGIKHDCSKVMEIWREGEKYKNGFGETLELEDTYLFPMMKSSQVAKGKGGGDRFMIVTQRIVGDETKLIEKRAPRTWKYLKDHADLLDKRGSSIYQNRPPFSIFGIGDYAFAPWKVAISGFYKKLAFVAIGPSGGKPVVLDDTSYFLPCQIQEQAEYLTSLLNSPAAQEFYRAFVFWDAKRPITAELLKRLDHRLLAEENGSGDEFNKHFGKPEPALFT